MTEMTLDGVPDYHSDHMVPYKEPEGISYTSLKVLEFLNGQPWDNLALGYVHALRPSSIRVSTGCLKCDARSWRVTVIVDEQDIIKEITQEVEVGLYGWQHGEALNTELQSRLDGNPPQGPKEHDWSDKVHVYCPYVPLAMKDYVVEIQQEAEHYFGIDCEDELTKALIAEVEESTKPGWTLTGVQSMSVRKDR